jgi:hypothetical protein
MNKPSQDFIDWLANITIKDTKEKGEDACVKAVQAITDRPNSVIANISKELNVPMLVVRFCAETKTPLQMSYSKNSIARAVFEKLKIEFCPETVES